MNKGKLIHRLLNKQDPANWIYARTLLVLSIACGSVGLWLLAIPLVLLSVLWIAILGGRNW